MSFRSLGWRPRNLGVAQERTRILFVGMRKKHMAAFRVPPAFPEWRANMGDLFEDLMASNGWAGAKDWADARRSFVSVRNGVEKRGALASTVFGRKGSSREKEAARWAKKGIDIATVADAAPTQEQAEKAGPGFLPQLTLRMRARLQGFPDYWDLVGGKDASARQVGNAVPRLQSPAISLCDVDIQVTPFAKRDMTEEASRSQQIRQNSYRGHRAPGHALLLIISPALPLRLSRRAASRDIRECAGCRS